MAPWVTDGSIGTDMVGKEEESQDLRKEWRETEDIGGFDKSGLRAQGDEQLSNRYKLIESFGLWALQLCPTGTYHHPRSTRPPMS